MLTISYKITIIQARILLVVGLVWLALGLYWGFDPLAVAWRAAAGATVAAVVSGYLLRLGAEIIQRRLQELDEAEPATADEQAQAPA